MGFSELAAASVEATKWLGDRRALTRQVNYSHRQPQFQDVKPFRPAFKGRRWEM